MLPNPHAAVTPLTELYNTKNAHRGTQPKLFTKFKGTTWPQYHTYVHACMKDLPLKALVDESKTLAQVQMCLFQDKKEPRYSYKPPPPKANTPRKFRNSYSNPPTLHGRIKWGMN